MRRYFLSFGLIAFSSVALADNPPEDQHSQYRSVQPWALEISGTAHHFSQPSNSSERYNQQNWGLGVEYRQPNPSSRWATIYGASALKDSFGHWGGYAGVAREYTIGQIYSVKIQPGAGLFLFYRTSDFNGPHHWRIWAVPLVHFEETYSGLGLNVVVVPSIRMADNRKETGFIFFQGTIRF